MFEERFCEDQGIHCEIGVLIFEPLNLQHMNFIPIGRIHLTDP